VKKIKRALKNLYHLSEALIANLYYGFPGKKLKIIGVTGTDGKTTTCYMIYNVLKAANKKVGLITTIEVRSGSKVNPTGLHVTTPSTWKLNKLLKEMVDNNIKYTVLEVTSHGIAQHRIWGIKFLIGVITNVTHEHLDYHKNFENYLKTKSQLLQKSKYAVTNRNAAAFEGLMKYLGRKKVHTYGFDSTDDTNLKELKEIKLKLPGDYNKENALAAISVAKLLNLKRSAIKRGLEYTTDIKGRFNIIQETPIRVIIDFAHTPNALEQVLKEVKKTTKNRLHIIFGCAGERDRGKRAKMGKISVKYADKVILTAEDPRTENVRDINGQILEGVPTNDMAKIVCIENRKEAIYKMLKEYAGKGDTVIITGKGHEESMCFGKTEYPWNDITETKQILSYLNRKK